MPTQSRFLLSILLTLCAALALSACHASEDDPAGLADELSDAVRRQHSIYHLRNLHSTALRENDSDRSAAAVTAVVDASVEKLAQCYIDNRVDTRNGQDILDLLKEMQDARALPALVEALDWSAEVNEEHAIRAAQTIPYLELDDGQKAQAAEALAAAIRKVRQARPIDNRIRIEVIRALGELHHTAALPVLTEIATAQSETQNFQINRLAAQQIGALADASSVPAMIKGLYLFAPSNPAMRMNDVAAEALVRIGRPSLDPVLALMRGDNEEANAIADAYIAAVRERDENAAAQMSRAQVIGSEATFTLGSLGFAEAFDPLMAEVQSDDQYRRVNGAVALVSLNVSDAQGNQIREALENVYTQTPNDYQGVAFRAQLIAAMRRTYSGGYLNFFFSHASNSDEQPPARLEAVNAFALLANKTEMERLTGWLSSHESDPYHANFTRDTATSIAVANECDADLACYIGKLSDGDAAVVRKAAHMVGRLGQGNGDAIAALVGLLSHSEIEVRLSAIAALDRVATSGSAEAITRIDELRQEEEGRAIWTQFSRQALPIQARLRARTSG